MVPELIRGHPSPHGFDLCATAVGTVALDAIVSGADVRPGDALVGVPSSGLHSNGYTLARRVLEPLGLDARPDELEGASVADALLAPTVIYVRAALDLLASDVPVHGLAHITGGGLNNLTRLKGSVGWSVEEPLPVPAVISLIGTLGAVVDAEMWEVFNMGCGFVAVVPDVRADASGGRAGRPPPGRGTNRNGDRPRRRDRDRRPANRVAVGRPALRREPLDRPTTVAAAVVAQAVVEAAGLAGPELDVVGVDA